MSRSAKILLGAVLLLVAAGLVWLSTALGKGAPPRVPGVVGGRAETLSTEPDADRAGVARSAELDALPEARLDTPVVHPVWVELDILRAMGEVHAEGADPRGTGASARLRGSVTGQGGAPIQAEVEFVAGTNVGRILSADLTGAFGAVDLYPGPAVVRVSGPGIPGAEREVVLRQRDEALLHLSFARPTSVYGKVIDREGDAIAGVEVRLDGQRVLTDNEGEFHVPRVAPGKALCFVHKPGFAWVREVLHLSAGHTVPRGKLQFALEPGADLRLSFRGPVGGRGPAQVFLLPADWSAFTNARGQRTFPWHIVSPIELFPSGQTLVEDLPAGRLNLRVFHNGASSRLNAVHLRAGKVTDHAFQVTPAPMLTGRVTLDGTPVPRARVTVEAPDRVAATLRSFGEPLQFLETAVFPFPPTAAQVIETDAQGAFEVSPWYDVVDTRYVTAESPDGRLRDARVVRKGDFELELRLEQAVEPIGELFVEFSARQHPLPVRLVVSGEPRDPFAVPVGEDLRVDGLRPGTWKVRVRWRGEVLVDDAAIEVRPRGRLAAELPPGAVVGQSLEEQYRSGALPRPRDERFR